jgi:ArsR family transcriptional regulator
MCKQTQINSMLKIVENPIRRKIIKRLSQEPSYPLELSKEIGEAQQLVTSHLGILEKGGIVGSSIETSPSGPNRKIYFLKKSAAIGLSFGPNLFTEQFLNFDVLPSDLSGQATDFIKRISEIEKITRTSKIEPFSCLLQDIDEKIDGLDGERAVLLFIRNLAMKHVTEDLKNQQKNHDERRILHYILDERSKDIESISTALNLQESIVRIILEKVKNDVP